ncbi:protein transporter [Gyrodon lividus]|nr:protein transporter [Gyrodon lividus]
MSAPKILIQIVLTGAQIFGKALFEAGKQAAKNAKHRPEAISSDVAGVRGATSGSVTDKLTRDHRMTLDEAHLILNVKRGEALENVLNNYEHLFKVNSPRPVPDPSATGARPSKQPPPLTHSHYLQSKVVRARDRIEAELRIAQESAPAEAAKPGAGTKSTGPGSGPSPGSS